MLPEFQSMWDVHLRGITTAKNRIEKLDHHVDPDHLEPYRAGHKTGEFEEVKINKILKQQVIGPAQTKSTVPIVFIPKEDRILLSASIDRSCKL